jgi:hypothetical protein
MNKHVYAVVDDFGYEPSRIVCAYSDLASAKKIAAEISAIRRRHSHTNNAMACFNAECERSYGFDNGPSFFADFTEVQEIEIRSSIV